MNKIISYSLWGNDAKYIIGAYRNVELAKIWFPDWKVRIYISTKTSINIKSDNLEIYRMTENQSWDGLFWRFLCCDSDDIVIVRDLDDRLSQRHRFVVEEWLKSDKDLHIIRDHPNHTYPIMGGLWGSRNGLLKGISEQISKWENKNYYATDQDFLGRILYNKRLIDRSLIHDTFHKNIGIEKDINLERNNFEFLGDTFDENDVRNPDYWKLLK